MPVLKAKKAKNGNVTIILSEDAACAIFTDLDEDILQNRRRPRMAVEHELWEKMRNAGVQRCVEE